MKKIVPAILMAVLLLPAVALAENTSVPNKAVEDTTIPFLQIVSPSEYFKVIDKTVTEAENTYKIQATVKVKFDGSPCNHNAIRQLTIDVDETNEVLQCKELGLGVCSPKEVDFSFEVPKKKIDSIMEEEGQVTLIASRHSGWSCGWVKNKYPQESKGIKVNRFTPTMPMLPIIIVILIAVGAGVGYLIYKKVKI